MSNGSISRNAAKAAGGGTKEMLYLPPESLVIDKDFDFREDLGDIKSLAEDITEKGFLVDKPILVRVNKETGKFHVANGRRRTRACLHIKKESLDWNKWDGLLAAVPLDSKTTDEELLFKSINSNDEHQKQFTPMEEGAYFLKLRDDYKVSEADIAKRINRSVTTVRDRIALVNMEPSVKKDITKFIENGTMSPTTALEIAKKPREEQVAKWKELRDAHNESKAAQQTTGKNPPSKPDKIKVRDARGEGTHISVKAFKDNLAAVSTAHKDTGHDRYKFAMEVLNALFKGKVIKI